MVPPARALLGVAPALIVLAGSFAMSRDCVREPGVCEGDGSEGDSNLSEVVVWPSAEDQDRLRRVALKQESVEDLLTGQITLADAVERFETLFESSEGRTNLRTPVAGDSDGERALNQVLAFARVRAGQDPDHFGPALARVESAAKAFATTPIAN